MADETDDIEKSAEGDAPDAADITFDEGGEDEDADAAAWAAEIAAEGGGDEDGDFDEDVAAQWAAMIDDNEEGESAEGNEGGGERILNQDEIDSLLGFDLDEASLTDASGIRAIINSGFGVL